MTKTHDVLKDDIDRPTTATNLRSERSVVLRREDEAREGGEEDLVTQLAWERAIMDLNAPPSEEAALFRSSAYEAYAEFYGLTEDTVSYAQERAAETANLLLCAHHLEYLHARGPRSGREWHLLRRRLAETYRCLIDEAISRITGEPGDFEALYASRWMARSASLVSARGILRGDEPGEWSDWITGVAVALRTIDWKRDDGIEMHHRWPFEIVEHLVAIPADFISQANRTQALDLLGQARDHYSADPLADTFVARIAEVEASLRRHFGEQDSHRRMVRTQYEALLRAAAFHREHGNGLIAQHFFREARKLAERHRQYFDGPEVDELQRLEREALSAAEAGGEFKAVRAGTVEINLNDYDRRQGTASETVRLLLALRGRAIPEYSKLAEEASRIMRDHPIQFLFGAATVNRAKVVSEATTEEQHRKRVIQQQMSLRGEFVGLELVVTLVRAHRDGQLNAEDIVGELGLLGLDEEEMHILERGLERLLVEDYISAGHILASQFENAFRRKLTEVGVEPTRFRTLPDGTTRTDEAALGDLMHSSTHDGRTVRAVLGEDAWQFVDRTMVAADGWNLRNKFAHGLAGKHECAGPIVGVILHHIFWLATLQATAEGGRPESTEGADTGLSAVDATEAGDQ